jgi:hypothetical protein
MSGAARVRAWAAYALQRGGVAGAAGALLMAGAALAALATVLVDRDTVALLAAQQDARVAWQRAVRPAVAPPAALLEALPPDDAVAAFIDDLHRLAARHRVVVERAEYRTPQTTPASLRRTQVVLPATGRYPDFGAWLAALLRAHPSAALDELTLQRDAEAGQVRLRVVLSVYTRSRPGVGSKVSP